MKAFLASFMLAVSAPPAAAAGAAALIARLEGAWVSSGAAFGAPAESVMVWAPALDGKFTRLDYRIEMRPAGADIRIFEGVAYYERATGAKAFWADNSGDLHPIRTDAEGDALTAHWGMEGGKQGKTRYELAADGSVVVTDWILRNGEWRQFNANRFVRRATVE